MTKIRCIELASRSDLFPVWLLVHHVENGGQFWDIRHIEIFADPDHAMLIADDVQIADLPLSTQDALFAALDDHVQAKAQRERGMRQLLSDLQSDAVGAT